MYLIALTDLESLQKSHVLWQELNNDNGLVGLIVARNVATYSVYKYYLQQKQFFVPKEIQNSSFLCHVVVKDKDQQLLSHVICTYQTIKVMSYKQCIAEFQHLLLDPSCQAFDMLSNIYWKRVNFLFAL